MVTRGYKCHLCTEFLADEISTEYHLRQYHKISGCRPTIMPNSSYVVYSDINSLDE